MISCVHSRLHFCFPTLLGFCSYIPLISFRGLMILEDFLSTGIECNRLSDPIWECTPMSHLGASKRLEVLKYSW